MIQTEVGLHQSIELLAGQYRAIAALHRRIAPQNVANYRVFAEGPLEEIRRLQIDIGNYLQVPVPRTLEEAKAWAAVQVARDLFSRNPDWISFFREMMGVDGLVRRLFATPEELSQFEQSLEFAEIQSMLTALRDATSPPVVALAATDQLPSSPPQGSARETA